MQVSIFVNTHTELFSLLCITHNLYTCLENKNDIYLSTSIMLHQLLKEKRTAKTAKYGMNNQKQTEVISKDK